jgi:glycosyltransferase involved in cell wall biosynthesis
MNRMSDIETVMCVGRAAEPRVSWLMPLVPAEDPQNLAATLRCLRNQTLQAEQLVIAADGLLPDPLTAVIQHCGLNYTLHEQPRNLGIGATLAQAAPLCTGDFIVRIDSDDLYAPHHTSEVVNALFSQQSLGVVGCQLIEIDLESSRKFSARCTPLSHQETAKWLPWRNPLNHQTVAIRKQALEHAGGYRHMPGFEDWDLWLRVSSVGYKIKNLPTYTVAARVNQNHRLRRSGGKYVGMEIHFYALQVREGKIHFWIALMAFVGRLPWRIAPQRVLNWWMRSRVRGSPPLNTAWVTELLAASPR